MSAVRQAAQDVSRYWREQGPSAALFYAGGVVRAQAYLESDEIVICKDLPRTEPATTGTMRLDHYLQVFFNNDETPRQRIVTKAIQTNAPRLADRLCE